MAIPFQPPEAIIQSYLNRPQPAELANQGIQQAFQTYMQSQALKRQQQNEALGNYIKAFGEGGPKFAQDVGKRYGLVNPPALPGMTATMAGPGGTAGVMSNQQPVMAPPAPTAAPTPGFPPTENEMAAGMSMPSEHATSGEPTQSLQSPIVAHWNNTMGGQPAAGQQQPAAPIPAAPHAIAPSAPPPITPQGPAGVPGMENPESYLDMGSFGTKKLQAGEALGKYKETMQSAAEKDLLNAPRSANQLRQDFTLAGQPEKADAWIKAHAPQALENPDQPLINVAQIKEAKDWLGTGAMQMRGGSFESNAEVNRLKFRQGLIVDARKALDPYFSSGEGRAQIQRLNNIGRTEPLISQMLGQLGGGDPRQMRELATRVDSVLRGSPGGQQAIEGINGLMPDTAKGRFASFKEFILSDPQGTEQQAFIKRLADTTQREKVAIQGQVKQTAERTQSTLRLMKETYPEDYNAIVNPYLSGKYGELTGPQNTGNGPAIGTVEDGHRFKGGNPADPNSWEAI